MSTDSNYMSGAYWHRRADLLYYKHVDYMMRVIARDSKSVIDVGSGNCPYLEWWDWIEDKTSIDIAAPYKSKNVRAITANILDYNFEKKYDVCTCMQVLEHVSDPTPFARRLFDIGDIVIISVPYKWPAGKTRGHLQDPVDQDMLERWTGRKPSYHTIVSEPFSSSRGKRFIGIYCSDSIKRLSREDIRNRRIRDMGPIVPLP